MEFTSKTYQHLRKGSLAVLSFALLLIITGVMATAGTAEASSQSLSFDSTPTESEVRSGTKSKKVVKVRASGLDSWRIVMLSAVIQPSLSLSGAVA